jgi:hypothetical protein
MDVIQVEEKGFYVRLVCNKGEGVAPSLYKSLESLTSFQVQNSNLSSPSPDTYLLTYTLDVNQLVPFYFVLFPSIPFTYRVFLCGGNRGHASNRA